MYWKNVSVLIWCIMIGLYSNVLSFHGTIINVNGEAIDGAVVKIKDYDITAVSNQSGYFNLGGIKTSDIASSIPYQIGSYIFFQKENNQQASIGIFSIDGKMISFSPLNVEQGFYRLYALRDMKGKLPLGIYFARLTIGNVQSCFKIVHISNVTGGAVDPVKLADADNRFFAKQSDNESIILQVYYGGELCAELSTIVANGDIGKIVIDNRAEFSVGYIVQKNKDIVKSIEMSIKKLQKGSSRTYDVNVTKDGRYDVSILVHGVANTELSISVDDKKLGEINFIKNGWEKIDKACETISLSQGKHVISILSEDDNIVPVISDFQLVKEGEGTSGDITEFIDKYKGSGTPLYTSPSGKLSKNVMAKTLDVLVPSDPLYDYEFKENIYYDYTIMGWLYLLAGHTYTLETRTSSDGGWCDPVMYLFKQGDPSGVGLSWSDDDGAGFPHSRIVVTAPVSGYYMYTVRDYNHNYNSHCDIYFECDLFSGEVLLCSYAPLYNNCYFFPNAELKTGSLNAFTANPKDGGVHQLMLMEMQGSEYAPGLVKAHSNCYAEYDPSQNDFDWSDYLPIARIKNYPPQLKGVMINLVNMGTGYIDAYMNCDFSNQLSEFTYLKPDDAIVSSELYTNTYNCISWSGGRTDLGRRFWPPYPNNVWYDSGNPKQSFDNFYGNYPEMRSSDPKYSMTYVPTANEEESVVDLWIDCDDVVYTHASVRKPGDGWAHGYDWESKPGGLKRIFHPRHSLRSDEWAGYGHVSAYYKIATPLSKVLYKTAPAVKGDKLAPPIFLSESESSKLSNLVVSVGPNIQTKFNTLYDAWKKTWENPRLKMQSNPHMFLRSEEYRNLKTYCLAQGKKIIPLLYEKGVNGSEEDELANYAAGDLGILSETESIWKEVRQESRQGQITEDGYFLIETTRNSWALFIKKVLAKQF